MVYWNALKLPGLIAVLVMDFPNVLQGLNNSLCPQQLLDFSSPGLVAVEWHPLCCLYPQVTSVQKCPGSEPGNAAIMIKNHCSNLAEKVVGLQLMII